MKKSTRQNAAMLVAVLGLMFGAAEPTRAEIIGTSSLVNASDLNQLEGWLGEGSLTLTKIFSHTAGDGKTATDFHTAVDGKGRTFVVIELLATQGNTHQIIGGYDPQSWSSSGSYNITSADAERTAFLFNLTSGDIQRQKLSTDPNGNDGKYQTYDSTILGPTFGGGYDLSVGFSLNVGRAENYTYGTTAFGDDITGSPYSGGFHQLDLGTMEVFTIADAVVPEPSTLLTSGLACLMGLGYAWRCRRAKAAA